VLVAMAVSMTGTITLISVMEYEPHRVTGMAQSTGSGIANVTLATEANIHLEIPIVEFNSIAAAVGTSNDTTDFHPHPFVLENNGTARLNISVSEANGNTLWEQNDSSHCFQFNSTANNSNTLATQYMAAAWADFDGANQTDTATDLTPEVTPNLVWNLSTQDGYDLLTIHIRIEVPQGEEGGVKEATVFFEGTAAN